MSDSKIVEIERNVGGSFGFSVIGGVDTELPPMVCALVHNGSAQLSGKIHVGDVLVEVNDECVSRLPAKKVVESLKLSPDTLKLRLRKDLAAVARARPYLRRFSVQDPKLQQFQTRNISNFRRTASLPSRSKRPVLRTRSDAQFRAPDTPCNMLRGKTRIVGQATSPTGMDRGTDGTFRRRTSVRSGSFSKIMTSFPAHGGPPRTVENAERTNVRHAVRTQDLTRTISDSTAIRHKGPLHSASLPEIGLTRVNKVSDSDSLVWHKCSSTGDGFQRRGSLSPAVERTTQMGSGAREKTQSSKDSSYGSFPQGARSCDNSLTLSMDSSPYPFRRPLSNSFGAVHSRSENHKGSNGRKVEGVADVGLSGEELAKKLFHLDGFNRNEVAPMLFKNDDYTKNVAVLFMKHFDFQNKDLVESLRMLLDKFNLTGETQERERILVPFSKRYYDCNTPDYGTADAVHMLVCAIMLLNTDLHGEQTIGRRMKQTEFMRNLSGMCDEKDYPANLLKNLYTSIKSKPLEFHIDDIQSNHVSDTIKANGKEAKDSNGTESVGSLALMGYQTANDDVIYKEGLLYRKLVEDTGGKKASAWKRSWQPFFATLRGMIIYLHKPDESRNFDDTRFSLGVHHAFASPAFDYKKKSFVFRFITADWKVLLFQARDKADMNGWVEGLNLVAASFSSPPLPAPVGSHKRFQKPVLPFSRTRLTLTQQLTSHETKAQEMADVLIDHLNKQPQGLDHRNREMFEWLEKRDFYDYEYKRYRSYTNILKSSKLQTQVRDKASKSPQSEAAIKRNGLLSENMRRYSSLNNLLDAEDGDQKGNPNYRESYFMAIYRG